MKSITIYEVPARKGLTNFFSKLKKGIKIQKVFLVPDLMFSSPRVFDQFDKIVYILTICISLISFFYFLYNNQILSDYDAIARLNIARKIIDSITPGIGQLGGIWLPFPVILMLPLTANNFLWHSGLAGSIISMLSFIIGGIFLYKTAVIITKNNYISFLVWLVYVSNINILLLQTMALSESFFLSSMIMTIYFLTRWSVSRDLLSLFFTGLSIILITLTRYEGYFIFIGAGVTVALISSLTYGKERNWKKVEGILIFFGTVASYGIFLWCIYCALFYKDPFYWLHLYTGPKGQIITTSETNAGGTTTHPKSLILSLMTYTQAMFWMNGILNSLLAISGFWYLTVSLMGSIKQKKLNFEQIGIFIIGLILFIFLIYGYMKNLIPDIEVPNITTQSILNKSFNNYSHSNIRYGMVMAPLIAIYIGFLASRKRFLAFLAAGIIALQLFTNYYSPYFLLFQLPKAWDYKVPESVYWFQKHYDKGLIFISANRHENFMFQTGLPYKDFIYEGSKNYWLTCLNDPEKYATWVVFDPQMHDDAVTAYLTKYAHEQLDVDFQLVTINDGLYFYKVKNPNLVNPLLTAK